MASRSTNRVRIAANYVRLVSSFALGLIVVRLLLGIGEQAYGLIALLGAGTGIASAIKEVVRASMVPELGTAYHSGSRDRFRQTYNAALIMSPAAAVLTLIGFALLAVSIRWIQVPDNLVWAAQCFIAAKAVQTFFTICLAPTFNMYMVTERMVAYNFWVIVERLAELTAISLVVLTFSGQAAGFQIVAYATLSAGLSIACLLLSSALLMRDVVDLRPQLGSATVAALKSVLHSVGWNAVVVLAMNLYTRVDMFIINVVFGLFGNLVFGVASQLTSYIRLLTMGVVAGVDAVAARLSSGDNQQAFRSLMRQSTRLQAMIVFPATFALLFLAQPLIALWVGSQISDPETTIPVVATLVRIMIVGIAARSLSEGWMRILAGAGQVRLYAPTVLITAIANPIIVCLLIFLFRAEHELFAPAVAFSCLLFGVHLVYIPLIVARHCDLGLRDVLAPLQRPLIAALASVLFLIVAIRLSMNTSMSLLVSVAGYAAFYSIACYFIVLEPTERRAITSILRNRRVDDPRRGPPQAASVAAGNPLRWIIAIGAKAERMLTQIPGMRFVLCTVVVEMLSRGLSTIGANTTRYGKFGLERRIRGVLLSARFRAVGLQIDRWVQIESPQHVVVGNGVTLYGGSHFVAGRTGEIQIGKNSHIGRNCVLSGLGGIRIGEGCAIASSVCIYSVSNHIRQDPLRPILDSSEYRQVTIGDDVWIGAGARILPGVEIGDHAVIGAGTVVNRSILPWKVAVGVPAKVIKDRRDAAPGTSPHDTRHSEAA